MVRVRIPVLSPMYIHVFSLPHEWRIIKELQFFFKMFILDVRLFVRSQPTQVFTLCCCFFIHVIHSATVNKYFKLNTRTNTAFSRTAWREFVKPPFLCLKVVQPTCPPAEKKTYDRVVHFRFWYFGQWVDVYVDDAIPLQEQCLVMTSHSTPFKNDIGITLAEKAYAKYVLKQENPFTHTYREKAIANTLISSCIFKIYIYISIEILRR